MPISRCYSALGVQRTDGLLFVCLQNAFHLGKVALGIPEPLRQGVSIDAIGVEPLNLTSRTDVFDLIMVPPAQSDGVLVSRTHAYPALLGRRIRLEMVRLD